MGAASVLPTPSLRRAALCFVALRGTLRSASLWLIGALGRALGWFADRRGVDLLRSFGATWGGAGRDRAVKSRHRLAPTEALSVSKARTGGIRARSSRRVA